MSGSGLSVIRKAAGCDEEPSAITRVPPLFLFASLAPSIDLSSLASCHATRVCHPPRLRPLALVIPRVPPPPSRLSSLASRHPPRVCHPSRPWRGGSALSSHHERMRPIFAPLSPRETTEDSPYFQVSAAIKIDSRVPKLTAHWVGRHLWVTSRALY
jgi:hypothetical protein